MTHISSVVALWPTVSSTIIIDFGGMPTTEFLYLKLCGKHFGDNISNTIANV